MMTKPIVLLAVIVGTVGGQERPREAMFSPRVYVQSQDKVLPQIVTGGNWETVVVILNMSTVSTNFNLNFYDENGAPLPLTFITFPDNQTVTSAAATGLLVPGGSFNFSLTKAGPLRVGWAVLTYDDTRGRLGGNAVLRQYNANNVPGAIFEAVVPFSNMNDYNFYMPFDNLQGFSTAMALVNTGSLTGHVSLTFLDNQGRPMFQDTITLRAGNHTAFSVPAQYPAVAGSFGTIYVQSDTTFLAGLGLRFNPVGPFTSVPILNWSGMFP